MPINVRSPATPATAASGKNRRVEVLILPTTVRGGSTVTSTPKAAPKVNKDTSATIDNRPAVNRWFVQQSPKYPPVAPLSSPTQRGDFSFGMRSDLASASGRAMLPSSRFFRRGDACVALVHRRRMQGDAGVAPTNALPRDRKLSDVLDPQQHVLSIRGETVGVDDVDVRRRELFEQAEGIFHHIMQAGLLAAEFYLRENLKIGMPKW